MSKVTMSPTAITMQLERLSQIRKLGLLLKHTGKKVKLHNQSINSNTYNNPPNNLPQR
jgi:hypothetical protein